MQREEKVYFIADAHLGAKPELERKTVPALLSLLDEIRRERASLYILGDLFDFWFEFRHSIPKIHPSVISKLYELREAGCSLGFAGGNHDFWMGGFLARELGFAVSPDWLEREIQGKKVCMSHGDGLISGDTGYKILKRVLRSPVNIALYRLLPPGVGISFALACSRAGRETPVAEMRRIAEKLFLEVATRKFEEGFDLVVLGHVHLPYEKAQGDRRFLIVGDWIENLSYLVMEGGEIHRRFWKTA